MADSGTYDDATLLRRQKIAEALYADAIKPRKIEHWTQGLAQMAQAGIQGAALSKYDQQAKDNEAALARTYAGLLGGGAAPAAVPAASPQSTPTGGAPMVTAPMGNKVAAAMGPRPVEVSDIPIDGPSPLDPPSGADRDRVIRTMLAEAGNQGPQGMNAVASVVRNRAVNGETTPSAVVQAPNQFEPWNTQAGRQKMASIDPSSPQYAAAAQALESAYAGNDPTGGATHFYAPKAQAALGRPAPAWDNGKGVDIGDHRFFGGNPVAQAMSAPAPAAPAAPAQSDARTQIAGLLNSTNPAERRIGMQLAQNVISQQFKSDQPTDEMREYNLDSAQRKARGEQPLSFFDFKSGLKKAGATNVTTNIDQKPELEFDKAAAKHQAERFNELAADGQQARQMVSDVQTLTQLGNQIGTGKGAEFKAKIGPYAEAVGAKIEGLSDIQAFEAVVNRVAPNLRVKGSGAQSDYELKNFLKSIPSLGNTPEGNALIGKTLEGLAQNKIKAAEIGSRALNKQISRADAEKMLRELPDPMEEWRQATKEKKSAPANVDALKKKYGLD